MRFHSFDIVGVLCAWLELGAMAEVLIIVSLHLYINPETNFSILGRLIAVCDDCYVTCLLPQNERESGSTKWDTTG